MNPYLLLTILGAAHESQKTQNSRRSATRARHAERRRSRVSHQDPKTGKHKRLSLSIRVAAVIALAFAFIIGLFALTLI